MPSCRRCWPPRPGWRPAGGVRGGAERRLLDQDEIRTGERFVCAGIDDGAVDVSEIVRLGPGDGDSGDGEEENRTEHGGAFW